MTNLEKLRKELDLTIRDFDKYVDISYSVISLLEREKRTMREVHIQRLSAFFNVTSDYLLGKSNVGYIVFPDGYDEEIIISEEEYLNYKKKGKVKTEIIKLSSFNATILEEGKEPKVIYQPPYQVIRTIDMGAYAEKKGVIERLTDIAQDMTIGQILDTIDFIKKYIL